jgi:hypothetical protein
MRLNYNVVMDILKYEPNSPAQLLSWPPHPDYQKGLSSGRNL